jgi:surface antigen
VEKATHELLELGKKGDERTWSNADSGNSGILKLVDIYDDMTEERECRELTITVRDKKEVINSNNIVLCRPSGGKWDFK